MNIQITLKSRNAKTGPIPVSTSSMLSCSTACPFMLSGCYAAGGPLAIIWRKVTDGTAGGTWDRFIETVKTFPVGQLWRHNQAGDLAGVGDNIDLGALRQLVDANRGKRGFTYTHKPMAHGDNIAAVREANQGGFTVNLSGNTLEHADELSDLDIGPVVVVLPSDQMTATKTPAGRAVAICPAVLSDSVTCKSCGLCAIADRKAIVGFPAHGAAHKKASAIASA